MHFSFGLKLVYIILNVGLIIGNSELIAIRIITIEDAICIGVVRDIDIITILKYKLIVL